VRCVSATVAAEELQQEASWVDAGEERKDTESESSGSRPSCKLSRAVPRCAEEQAFMAGLTALPLGHFLAKGGAMSHFSHAAGKAKGKGKGKSGERSVALSNDSKQMWIKPPPSRAIKVHIVAGQIRTTILLTMSTTLNTYGASQFSVSQLAETASWTAVFDEYRITAIEVELEFPMTESTSITQDAGRYVSVIDTDDATVPTNLDLLTAYSCAVESSVTQKHYHRWAPGVAVDLYTGAFGGFGNVTSPWIDCGSTTVLHYGLKYGCTPGAAVGTMVMTYKFHVEFRATH